MCLAFPGRVEKIEYPYAVANFGGTKRKVRIDLVDELKVGEYVLVHVGFAIQKVNEDEARQMEEIWKELIKSL
jgi:hydrogenase expression/formation protein HypC